MKNALIIIPIHNGASTIEQTFDSLLDQVLPSFCFISKIIIVDDCSSDNSPEILKEYKDKLHLKFKSKIEIISNIERKGLANNYNLAMNEICDYIITLHQDIILHNNSLISILSPLANDSTTLASKYISFLPLKIWTTFNFWQKSFFDRFLNKKVSSHDGKFNAFKKTALDQVGWWDAKTFNTAGEDGDMLRKLVTIGTFSISKAQITHIHSSNPNFSWRHIIQKHAQYAEANGAILRRYGLEFPHSFIIFFREILVIITVIYPLTILGLVLTCAYTYLYTKNTYKYGTMSLNISLFILNITLIYISFFYSLKGFLTGKQL